MKAKKAICSLMLGVSLFCAGCGNEEIARLRSLPALNTSAEGDDYRLTMSERQSLVYSQVSERQLLDLSLLDQCTDEELQQVVNYMNSVDSQLTGQVKAEDGVIDECFTDYLLVEFEKTPYYWQRSQMDVYGVDAESRSIVVDVTYKTTGFEKEVVDDSYIVKGEPNCTQKESVRYERWLEVLGAKYNNLGTDDGSWQKLWHDFASVYGEPEDIFESQRNLTPTDMIFETGNQHTYNGCIDSANEKGGATMVVRYVLVPKFVMGINLGITCKHMYVVDYSIGKDPTEGLEVFKADGYTTVTEHVQELMKSYFQCYDEMDMDGLYKLVDKFKMYDKHYQDIFDTHYTKHNNFSVTLFNIEGTKVSAGVQVSSETRAKGSDMTMPGYTDRYLVNMELIDDRLKIVNMVLISRKLEGEPAIETEDAEDAGFTASIDLEVFDREDIEKLIAEFGKLQLLGDYTSDDFSDVVDFSVSDEHLNEMRNNMAKCAGVRKAVWLQNYQQGTKSYASVKCREIYQAEDNSCIEASVVYEFIVKGGRWYVYDYRVLSNVRLDTTNFSTTNALCYVTPGKIEQFTSQIVETNEENKDEGTATKPTEVATYTYKETPPQLKTGTSEQGLVKLTADDIDDEKFVELWNEMSGYVASEFVVDINYIRDAGEVDFCKRICACYYNEKNSRYVNNEAEREVKSMQDYTREVGSTNASLQGVLDNYIQVCIGLEG